MVYESMAPGEVLVNCSGGGGGWGNPLKRDPEKVLEDIRNEYVSLASAREDYGVVIDPQTLTLDTEATATLRQERLRDWDHISGVPLSTGSTRKDQE